MKITLLTGKIYELSNAFDFPLTVSTSLTTRRMSLRIDTKKRQVVLNLPRLCSYKRAHAFVLEHLDWIETQLAKIPPEKEFADGDTFTLFGNPVTISYLPQSLRAPYLDNGILYVGGDQAFIHRRVKDYIKKEAKKDFLRRSRLYADKLGCHISGVTIKDTTSRWGSCSTLNNINYNWRIALAPESVIEYLMAHEVSHLLHRDHSPAFWHCVKELYPGAAMGKAWLKANGNTLYKWKGV